MSDILDCFFLAEAACLAAQSIARGERPEGGRFAESFTPKAKKGRGETKQN